MYVLIPAGGSGTRLWPSSRSNHPKQLLNLTGRATMIQETLRRIDKFVPAEQILVITEKSHAGEIQAQIPEVPAQNFLIEPARRDTAAVVGLGAMQVFKRDPNAVVAALHADHLIAKPKAFLKVLRQAEKIALEQDVIVTIGIHPTHPATCYGYIGLGEELSQRGTGEVFRVKKFTEKPNLPLAQAFLATGEYFWNAGMFIARASVILDAYRKHAPKLYAGLEKIAESIGTKQEEAVLEEVYNKLPKEPVDTAIMEKTDNIVVIPADIGWSDIGSWNMLKEVLPNDASGNLALGDHIGIDTANTVVYAQEGRLVATIGVKDMIVIDAGDALLVCPLDQAEKVKKMVDKLKAHPRYKKYV